MDRRASSRSRARPTADCTDAAEGVDRRRARRRRAGRRRSRAAARRPEEIATASKPSAISGAWSPSPDGSARRASWVQAELAPAGSSDLLRTRRATRSRPVAPRRLPFPPSSRPRMAGRGSAAPGCEITTTPSIDRGSGRLSASSRTPGGAGLGAAHRSEHVGEPVADPEGVGELDQDPGRRGARRRCRAAGAHRGRRRRRTVSSVSPGSVSTTFRRLDVVALVGRLEALLGDGAGGDLAEMLGDEVGDRCVALAARRAIGSGVTIWRASAAARSPSNSPRRVPGSSASGAPSSENMTTTTAIRAGTNASR